MDEDSEWQDVPEPENGSILEGEERFLAEENDNEEVFVTLKGPESETIEEKTRRGLTKKEREERLLLHEVHLVTLLAHGLFRSACCNSTDLQSAIQEEIPGRLKQEFSTKRGNMILATNQGLHRLVDWLKGFVQIQPPIEVDVGAMDIDENDPDSSLLPYFRQKKGSQSIAAQLFVAVCRSLGLLTRLVISLQAIPLKISSENATNNPPPLKRQKTADSENQIPLYWAEAYSIDDGRWIALDCVRGKVDDPYSFEPPIASKNPLLYAIAFQGDGTFKDVTRRYSGHWGARTSRARLPDPEWWLQFENSYHPRQGSEFDRNREVWEDSELSTREKTEVLPKTLDEYKNHPLYVLERHLKKNEVIYPNKTKLGHFRGEPVFSRGDVKILRNENTWLKLARVIKEGEKPFKFLKVRTLSKGKKDQSSSSSTSADSNGNISSEQSSNSLSVPVYGIWQTCAYRVQSAQNGKVPKNSYGNVYLYQPSMLPPRTVHIDYPRVKEVAKRFGIDFGEAVVGMQFVRGKMVPIIDGIVVCQEYETILFEACMQKEEIKQEESRKIKEKEVLMRWRKFTEAVLLRHRLKSKYFKVFFFFVSFFFLFFFSSSSFLSFFFFFLFSLL